MVPIRLYPTAITVVTPKFERSGKVETRRAANPAAVASPETAIARPIRWTERSTAAWKSSVFPRSSRYRSSTRIVYSAATPIVIAPRVAVMTV